MTVSDELQKKAIADLARNRTSSSFLQKQYPTAQRAIDKEIVNNLIARVLACWNISKGITMDRLTYAEKISTMAVEKVKKDAKMTRSNFKLNMVTNLMGFGLSEKTAEEMVSAIMAD